MAGSRDSGPKLPRSAADREEFVRKLLTKAMRYNLYSAGRYLNKDTERRTGLRVILPIYIQDPLVAEKTPELGIQEIDVKWEPGLSDGPTSARIAVVDYNADTGVLTDPAVWDEGDRRFVDPDGKAVGPKDPASFQFHQVNVWATIQRIIEFYEHPRALGRPVLWGFNGGRLIVVPHAGYGENAYYDRNSKSLQFYYYGSTENPSYTCLSHDIVAHETGHAILDGIRPYYYKHTSMETAAFHEFVGDLTAITMALHNQDIRRHLADVTKGDLTVDTEVNRLAEEFGKKVEHRDYLRNANNRMSMTDISDSSSPHPTSQVLTGAMFDILTLMAKKLLEDNEGRLREATPAQALWWAVERFGRVALQPLDLCPPVDIRFIDYVRAVIRNDELTNALDPQGYRQMMKDVFHDRGFCQRSEAEHEQGICDIEPEQIDSRYDFIYHSIERIARSRAAAYYFLDDNRAEMHIPYHQDIIVADLYDTNKYGRAAERLPRQVVLEYIWQEDVELKGSQFGDLEGKTTSLLCGGTIVFDGRGNVISWFRKPGTEVEEDKEEGLERRQQLLNFIGRRLKKGMVGFTDSAELGQLGAWSPPILARPVNDTLEFELIPHLHGAEDENTGEDEWTTNF